MIKTPGNSGRLLEEAASMPLPDDTLQNTPSGCATRFNLLGQGSRNRRRRPGIGGVEAGKDLIGRVLESCIRLVQLPGCFASQLTELVAIGHLRKCPKYQIRTHYNLSF
jgi:hypothetical protein